MTIIWRFIRPLLNLKRYSKLPNGVPINSKSNYNKMFVSKINFSNLSQNAYWAVSILTWLGFSDSDEEKDSELITTLKRAVLCTRREQFNKAEQLLHVALRIAQQTNNEDGIVYCFDLMANLSFERGELEKSEKLFVTVLKILMGKGMKDDDLKVIHISLKLARICQLKSDPEKAALGYTWCLNKIEKHRNDNLDAQVLYGVINDWYAQFLLDEGDIQNSLKHLAEAYKICDKIVGSEKEQTMLLLNDLAITSFRAGDSKTAEFYLNKGIKMMDSIEDQTYAGILHANLGLILLHRGISEEAKKLCKEAFQLGKKNKNEETVEQANYCFEQIKLNLKK